MKVLVGTKQKEKAQLGAFFGHCATSRRFVDSSTLLTECNSDGVTDEHLPGGHDGEVGDVDQHVDDRHHGDGDPDGEGQVHLAGVVIIIGYQDLQHWSSPIYRSMSIDKFDNNLEQFWKKTPNSAFSSLLKTLLRYN